MAATYSTSLTTSKDKVRFYIGDTDVTTGVFMLSDEEIAAVLALYSDVVDASCECLESLLSRFAFTPSTSTLGLSIGSERYQQVKDRLKSLRSMKSQRALSAGCGITVGGRLLSERDELAADSDVVQPSFTINQHDHPESHPVTTWEED